MMVTSWMLIRWPCMEGAVLFQGTTTRLKQNRSILLEKGGLSFLFVSMDASVWFVQVTPLTEGHESAIQSNTCEKGGFWHAFYVCLVGYFDTVSLE